MTPREQALRRKLTGLKVRFHRITDAASAGRARSGKKHRDRADRLRKEIKQLGRHIERLAPAPLAPTLIRPGRYRHYKGKKYEVVGMARHSETMEELVVYRALYGERGLWVRPKKMFQESVVIDGQRVPRFELLGLVKSPKYAD